jgi:hypothetical protein
MSYDVTFIRKSERQTWQEAIDANEARSISRQPWNAPATEAAQSEWNRIAGLLLESHPGLSVYQAPHTLELSDIETGLQVSLYEGEAAITIPYGRSPDTVKQAMTTAKRLTYIIERETGLLGYDPQRGCRFLETEAAQKAKRRWWMFWKR